MIAEPIDVKTAQDRARPDCAKSQETAVTSSSIHIRRTRLGKVGPNLVRGVCI
jgi:hypothetical protein